MAMRKFKYVAVNLQKQKIKGTFIANDEKDLAQQLAKQSLFVVSCKPYDDKAKNSFFSLSVGSVKQSEITSFCRQFAIMLNTYIPILDCLDILKNQSYSPLFVKVLDRVYDDVKGGAVLSEALEKHPKIFPDFFRSMVYVGEQSGKIDIVLTSLADYYEKDSALKRKTKSALAYPTMLAIMAVAIIALMFGMVVPSFRNAMSKLEVDSEGITKIIYDLSDFFTESWQDIVLGVVVFVLVIVLILMTEKGKYAMDWLKFKLPLIKTVQQNILTARFSRAFGLLIASGMDITDAMDSVEVILGNRYMKKRFHDAAESIRHGMSLTVAFDSYKLFPQMMIQMIHVGEKTGTLDEVLVRACEFFDTQVETSLNSLVSKIQPTMLCIIGAIVGTLFVAIYSPMLNIMSGLGR